MTSQPPESGSPRAGPSRVEPWLDRLGELRFGEQRDRVSSTTLHSRRWWLGWGGIVALIAASVLLLLLRQPLSDWLWPETKAQQLREDAAQALAAGRLTSADGSGARELYEAALALDPDRSDARDGLDRVGHAALEQARVALARGRYADAHRALELARELSIPRARVDALGKQLREREAADAGIEQLLEQAAAARTAGRLEGADDAALPLYQRVLALQPNHTGALEGREDTLADLLQQAHRQLAAGELIAAAAVVRRVQRADPGHVELLDVLAELAKAGDRQRRQADRELRRGRLPRALEGYRAAIAINPEDAEAERGVVRVADAYARRSGQFAADFRFAQAEAALRDARAIAADAPAVAEAEQHLARARQSQRRMRSTMPPAQRQQRLRQLLAEAAEAEARGDLLTPPGDSAFDKLRAARAIAPQDARVKGAAARLLPAARTCFERELRGNRLGRAGECLDARRALEGDNAAVREGRRRLAQRWIAVGGERLGAGEVRAAQAALVSARALDPDAVGLQEFVERLRAATAASSNGNGD
jgi:tetratricopeptide (TPR) repeat protein